MKDGRRRPSYTGYGEDAMKVGKEEGPSGY